MNGALRRLSQPLAHRLMSPGATFKTQSRGFAADAHGEVKVNFWEDPTNISKWKEEHIVLMVLGAWGIVITTCMKTFGGKKEKPSDAPGIPVAPQS